MRTRVKICGITRIEDGLAAARFGADAIGLVFYRASRRCVTVEQARAITCALPPFIARVGLFVDAAAEEVQVALRAIRLDLLQFHGNESAEVCNAFHRPYIKAIRMAEEIDLYAAQATYASAVGLLLDTHVPELPGGSGDTFNWARVPYDLEKPVILAGGLTAANVQEAIKGVRPFAVDVSSGVESVPGIKDPEKISEFIRKVREIESDSHSGFNQTTETGTGSR
ncbi:MAG: phosphoribosylanthranilate isomerase [Acidiferrobacterales bacterium]